MDAATWDAAVERIVALADEREEEALALHRDYLKEQHEGAPSDRPGWGTALAHAQATAWEAASLSAIVRSLKGRCPKDEHY